MIYLLHGSDTEKSREKLHALVASMIAKKPDASHARLTEENFNEASLDELIGSSGLFASKMIVEVDMLFKNKDVKEILLARLKDISESENIFVFLEGELDKKSVEKFKKHAEKVQDFGASGSGDEAKPHPEFKIFSLTDALGRRDKKQLWVLYSKAKRKEISAEEIHGILFWQIKAMLQTLSAKSATDAGLNPFVFQKSSGFLKNFKPDEIKNISSRLVSLYHNARRGIVDFDTALEKFILEV